MQSANLNIDSGAAFGLYTDLLTNPRDAVRITLRVLGFEPNNIREEKPPGMRVPSGFFVANSACDDVET